MGSNRLVAWTAFTLFVLAVVVAVLVVFAPTLAQFGLPVSEAAVWVIGLLALLSAILGFIAFKTPQGKIAAIGGCCSCSPFCSSLRQPRPSHVDARLPQRVSPSCHGVTALQGHEAATLHGTVGESLVG